MKISFPITHRRARLEIIPLIDIMFFLLAAFVLVSVTLHKNHCIPMSLQTASTSQIEEAGKPLYISISKLGQIYLDQNLVSMDTLREQLKVFHKRNPQIKIFIAGDRDTPHGNIISVLDCVRSAGIQKIGFNVNTSRP